MGDQTTPGGGSSTGPAEAGAGLTDEGGERFSRRLMLRLQGQERGAGPLAPSGPAALAPPAGRRSWSAVWVPPLHQQDVGAFGQSGPSTRIRWNTVVMERSVRIHADQVGQSPPRLGSSARETRGSPRPGALASQGPTRGQSAAPLRPPPRDPRSRASAPPTIPQGQVADRRQRSDQGVRMTPCRVRSKDQERTTAAGMPTASAAMTAVRTQSGMPDAVLLEALPRGSDGGARCHLHALTPASADHSSRP